MASGQRADPIEHRLEVVERAHDGGDGRHELAALAFMSPRNSGRVLGSIAKRRS
jgi:hypothetical protein